MTSVKERYGFVVGFGGSLCPQSHNINSVFLKKSEAMYKLKQAIANINAEC